MKSVWSNGVTDLYCGDARHLDALADQSVHCTVTSPPYWGLRDYKIDDGIGMEPTLADFMDNMRRFASEVWRVLRDDGTFWLNLGDAYAGSWGAQSRGADYDPERVGLSGGQVHAAPKGTHTGSKKRTNLTAKNLIGIPWRVAFALQDDGWILRSAITWSKPNPMPESVRDRPTSAYEMIFLLTKQGRYFYDSDAIREQYSPATIQRVSQPIFGSQKGGHKDYGDNRSSMRGVENLKDRIDRQRGHARPHTGFNDRWDSMSRKEQLSNGANARNVWTIATQPRPDAHFATFPDELPQRCILAGTSEFGVCAECGAPWERVTENQPQERVRSGGKLREHANRNDADGLSRVGETHRRMLGWSQTCECVAAQRVPATVLDPFVGSGTTMAIAQSLGRRGVGVDLNPDYLDIARNRIGSVNLPLF